MPPTHEQLAAFESFLYYTEYVQKRFSSKDERSEFIEFTQGVNLVGNPRLALMLFEMRQTLRRSKNVEIDAYVVARWIMPDLDSLETDSYGEPVGVYTDPQDAAIACREHERTTGETFYVLETRLHIGRHDLVAAGGRH